MEKKFFGFSKNVFVLSLVSFLNDFAGETIKRTLALFLVNILGAGTSIVGLVEGVAEAASTVLQAPGGRLSDILGKRKIFYLFGRILSLARVFLFLSTTFWHVLLIRFSDRVGKGIGNAPRDALIAESTPSDEEGKAFGFNRAADSVGAVLGLILAALIAFLIQRNSNLLSANLFTTIVVIGAVPTVLNVFLVLFFVQDVKITKTQIEESKKEGGIKNLGRPFLFFLFISTVFTLGNSSDAFLVLRAQNVGLPLYQTFIVIALFSLVSSIIFLPAGIISDKIGRKGILALGWFIYGTTYLGFAFLNVPWLVWLFYLLYGVYFGLTEGVAKAYIVDMVPENLKGTAFGVYNTIVGLTLFPASLAAGALWQFISPASAFLFGAILAFLASFLLFFHK